MPALLVCESVGYLIAVSLHSFVHCPYFFFFHSLPWLTSYGKWLPVQDDFIPEKRSKPSLSIVNPLDVLRQRLLLEIARRQMRENSKQVILLSKAMIPSVFLFFFIYFFHLRRLYQNVKVKNINRILYFAAGYDFMTIMYSVAVARYFMLK